MIIQALFNHFRTVMEAVVPAEVTPSALSDEYPARYQHIGGFEKFARTPKQRAFCVINARQRGTQVLHVSGSSGVGRYFSRVQVLTCHMKRGQEQDDFEAFLAEEHRRVIDFVLGAFRNGDPAGVPAGFSSIDDEGVIIDEDEDGPAVISVYQWVIKYRDTIAYP